MKESGLNQLMLAGKVKKLPKMENESNALPYAHMVISVPIDLEDYNNNQKSQDFKIVLWQNLAEKVLELETEIGDTVAIKGELSSSVYESNNTDCYEYTITARKIFFLKAKDEE